MGAGFEKRPLKSLKLCHGSMS